MVNLVENEVNNVSYDKNGDYSEREVIPLKIPSKNVTALDVTGYSEEDKLKLIEAYNSYQDYIDNHMRTLFNFDIWVEQGIPDFDIEVKYRKFNLERLKNI